MSHVRYVLMTTLSFLAPLALAGCFGTPDASSVVLGSSGGASPIDGSWITTCATGTGGPPGSNSVKEALVLGGGNFTYTQSGYSDSGCSSLVMKIVETGTFAVGGTDSVDSAATDVSFVQGSLMVTVETSAEQNLAETGNGGSPICNFGGTLPVGTPVNLAGLTCNDGGGGGSQVMVANGARLLNLYVLSSSALELGPTNNSGPVVGSPTRPISTAGGSTYGY